MLLTDKDYKYAESLSGLLLGSKYAMKSQIEGDTIGTFMEISQAILLNSKNPIP